MGGQPALHTLQINLEAPQARLQRSLQRAIDLVAFGLTAGAAAPEGQVRMPGPAMQFATAQNYAMSFAQAKEEFELWVLQSGFRDAVEGMQDFLEEARVVCAALALGPQIKVLAGWTPPFTRESAEGQRFHWLGLEKKLAVLKDQYDVAPGPELRTAVEEINQARHCLVHRGGVVGEPDLNHPEGLRISWRRLEFIVQDAKTGAQRPLVLNQRIEAESILALRIGLSARLFGLGERLSVTQEEFIGVCFTLLSVGQDLSASVLQYAQRTGVPPASTSGTERKAEE